MPNLETRMVFRAEDQSTPTINGVANALAGLSGEAESSADRLGRSLANIRQAMEALDKDDFGKALRTALKENQYAVDAWEQQTNLAFARIEQQARLRAAGVEASLRGMGVRSMSSIRDEIKGLGDAYSFAKEGGAQPGELAIAKENVIARVRQLAQELRKTWGDVVSRVSKLSEAIRWDKQYSPLSGPERQAELMAKLVKLRDAARSGDATDLGDVDSTVGDLLEVAKENLGATEEYFKVYDETQSLIGEIKSIATQQAATADAQVQQLAMEIATQQAQLEALNSINRGLGEVVGAVNNVSAAIGGAIQAANAAQAQASVTPAMVAQATPSPSFSYPQPEGGDGSGYAALKNLYGWSDLPGFEGGGDHPGGLRVVGEAGWEVEATGPARYYTHQQTRDLMSPVDMRPVVTVLGQVVDVLDDMRRESRQQSTVIADKLSGVRQGLRNVEERL